MSAGDSTYVSQLRQEVAQLRHTLDIRRGEIVLAEQRTAELMAQCSAIRDASLASSAKVNTIMELEEELQAARQEEFILRSEIRDVQNLVRREDEQRKIEQKQQLSFYTALLAQVDSVGNFCLKKHREEKEKPTAAISSLLSIGSEVVAEFCAAADAYQASEAAATRQLQRLQELHARCVAEIAEAALRNEQQRQSLEASWAKEEQRLQKELLDVRNRAREAEFHRQRSPIRVHNDDGPQSTADRSAQLDTEANGRKELMVDGGHFEMRQRHELATEVLDLEKRIGDVLRQRGAEKALSKRRNGHGEA